MMGFVKGKFYNRCTRIHELLANVLEQKLYERFAVETLEVNQESLEQVMSTVPEDPRKEIEHLMDPIVTEHLQKYEDFFQRVLEGSLGSTAQFWAIYIFLTNRIHRELQRCVKTNDISDYIEIFPTLLVVYFAQNRPNYARWGTLLLQKLKSAHTRFVENGAFSIRRTKKNYSRSAVDLSFEQTVNRDSASRMKEIVFFRNSESAMRRWSLSMTQRATAVTELRALMGLELGETATSQCSPSRIKNDNSQMGESGEYCNQPSSTTAHRINLLHVLESGQDKRDKFQEEWITNSSRFLDPVKLMTRTKLSSSKLHEKDNSLAESQIKCRKPERYVRINARIRF